MRDIHLAEAISWWPLAWGWWLVIVVSIAALILLFYALYRRHRKKATQRYALAELPWHPASESHSGEHGQTGSSDSGLHHVCEGTVQ